MSILHTIRRSASGKSIAGFLTKRTSTVAWILLALAGCSGGGGGGGGNGGQPPPVVLRPPVQMETLLDLKSRDPYEDELGTGYAHVCPGIDDREGPRSFLLDVSGFDPGRVDAMPADDELENTCPAGNSQANYHRVVNEWANGADYIQRNAGVIRTLIETMTRKYEINADDRFAIVAESMGGVVVRYALQQMESEGVAHNVDLFVSVDSPQKGAYVPIGTQHIADLFRKQGGQSVLDEIDTPAARQMLLYHYTQGSDAQTWHDLHGTLYYDELQGALGGFLRDPNIRTVGVSSGRIGGDFEQPLPGEKYYTGLLTLREDLDFDYAYNVWPCSTDFSFDVKIELLVDVQTWSLGFSGGAPQGLSTVASRKITAEIDDISLANAKALTDHFTDLVIDQLPGLCRSVASAVTGVIKAVVKPIAQVAINHANSELSEATDDFFAKTISVPTSSLVTEGAAGGTSDAIDQMRAILKNSNFRARSLDPDIASKTTNVFIPFASALMLDGIGPADLVSADTVRAASAFDEVYFETEENLPHLLSSSNWFEQEVLTLFDRP